MTINSPVQTYISVPVIHNTEIIRKLTKAYRLILSKRMQTQTFKLQHRKGSYQRPSKNTLCSCTESHTEVILLILAGMLCLHFASCLHAKSHQLEQS